MKRASYREAVAWIALNDEVECSRADEIAGFISTVLVADLFGVDSGKVATDVLAYRRKEAEANV